MNTPKRLVRKTNAISLDLETLGTDPGDCILSIGMVAFNTDTGAQGDEFFCSLNSAEQHLLDFTHRASTITWWAHKDRDEARPFLSQNRMGLMDGLRAAVAFINDHELAGGLWSRGYMDETMLKLAVRRVLGLEDPWFYRAAHDARTVMQLLDRLDIGGTLNDETWSTPFVGVLHHALDDAKHEAKLITIFHRFLNNRLGMPDDE